MTNLTQTAGVRPSTNSIVGLILIIAAVIAALIFIDSTLEKAEQRDLKRQAQQAHRQGTQLVKQGKMNQGIELLSKAHALQRENTLYELDLVDALIAARRTDEAQSLMNEILVREPDDGRSNLSAARLMLQTGKAADAISYYHRAVYGEWPKNAAAHRVSARIELVYVLVNEHRNRELLAELLNLEAEDGADPSIQKTLGHLFLVAGSPSRAAAVYQAMINRDPKDADTRAGLGEAELEQGRYRNAQAAFRAALRYKPQDASILRRLELSNMLTELDPTPRQLASQEKYRRSIRILQLAYDSLNACIAKHSGTPASESVQQLSAAHDMLAAKPPLNAINEFSEGVLGVAEKTWKTRFTLCGSDASPQDESLRLIIEKLER
jgi:tetratricopeptide (TPR) repeat protein